MRNKAIIIVVAVLIVALASVAVVYFMNQNKSDGSAVNPEQNIGGEESSNKIATEDFSVTLPAGWKKTISEVEGVLAMATDPNEVLNDAAARAVSFKSYLAITADALAGKSMDEYMASIKGELQKNIPGVILSNENALTINGRPTRALEAEMTQQGISFKVLLVAIQGDEGGVWVLSYNTVKSSWDRYRDAFAESVKSFVLKK
jgi:hypothetical protein